MSDAVNVVNPDGELVSLPSSQAAEATQPENGYRMASPEEVNQHFQNQKYSSTPQKILTAVEGVGEGILGPVSPYLEKEIGISTPENIRGRREAHPYIHGAGQVAGLAGGAFTGTGEAALLETAGKGVSEALGLAKPVSAIGKIGAAAARSATETALMQAGDETSKMILHDPNTSFQSAVTDVGLAAAMGAGGGAALGAVSPLWKATAGKKLQQFVHDFHGRLNQHLENPDPSSLLHGELSDLHGGIRGVANEMHGPGGIGAGDIEKLVPEMGDKIIGQAQNINNSLDKALLGLKDDPFIGKLQKEIEKYQGVVTSPEATSRDVFSATQDLKNKLQEWGTFNKGSVPLGEHEFRDISKSLATEVRQALEDQEVWGKAAGRQNSITDAFKRFSPALKDFESKFTSPVLGEAKVDPGKVNTYVNQLGNPNAEIKQEMLGNFLDAADKYKGEINKIHEKLGIESPFSESSTQAARASTFKMTPGAKAADTLVKRGLAGVAGKGMGTAIGAGVGAITGHGWLGAIIGEHALGPFFSSVLPSLVKPILGGMADGEALKSAIDYGLAVSRGNKVISKAAQNIFRPGAEVLATNMVPSEKDRKKLVKHIEHIEENPQDVFHNPDKFGNYLPAHSAAKGSTVGAAYDYLNGLKPKDKKTTFLDTERKPNAHQTADYERALDLAQQPAMIFKSIKDGTVSSKDIALIKSIYPAFYDHAVMKLHEALVDHVSKEETIPYKTRLGLSKFFGEPLDTTMQQFSIAAIQQSMVPPIPAGPPGGAKPSRAPAASKMKGLEKGVSLMQSPQQASEGRHRAQF